MRATLTIVGLFLAASGSALAQSPAAKDPPMVADAKEIIHLLDQKKFAEVTKRWNAAMLSALPTPKVEEFWTNLVAQVGALQSVGDASVMPNGNLQTVVLPLKFERAELVASVTYDSQGMVAGIYFNPKS